MLNKIVQPTDRILRMLSFLKTHNISVIFGYQDSNRTVTYFNSRGKITKNEIRINPNRVYKSPVNNEELAYIYTLSHEFGHVYDYLKRRATSMEIEREDQFRRLKILKENRVWHYAYKLLLFLYKDDKMILSEFNKHYEKCIGTYLRNYEI